MSQNRCYVNSDMGPDGECRQALLGCPGMAAIASVARPPLLGAGMLFGLAVALALVPEPQPPEARIDFGLWDRSPGDDSVVITVPPVWLGSDSIPPSNDVVSPAWMISDAQDWPRGMVMGRASKPVDRMDAEVIAHWLSGFWSWLASRSA